MRAAAVWILWLAPILLSASLVAGAEQMGPEMDKAELEKMVLKADSEAYLLAMQLGDEARPILVHLLEHADPRVRSTALACLDRIAGREAAPLFAGRLGDVDPGVRADALAGLRQRPDGRLVPDLLSLLDESPHSNVREELPLIIGLCGEPSAIPTLQEQLAREADSEVKESIRRALARLGEPGARQELLAQLEAPESETRYEGLLDFEYIDAPGELHRLKPLLNDRAVALTAMIGDLEYQGRFCDLTINLLERMFHAQLPFETAERENYTDEQIEAAGRIFEKLLEEHKTR